MKVSKGLGATDFYTTLDAVGMKGKTDFSYYTQIFETALLLVASTFPRKSWVLQ